MPESDLKLICQKIPVSDSGSVSTQANAILKGLTGDDVSFDIQVGEQPELYPAPLTHLFNKVVVGSTKTAELNGGYADLVSIEAKVDGNVVQLINNEYIVSASDDGKTLTVELSRLKFKSKISQITLTYQDPQQLGQFSITYSYSEGSWYGAMYLQIIGNDLHTLQFISDIIDFNFSYNESKIFNLGWINYDTFTVASQLPKFGLKTTFNGVIDYQHQGGNIGVNAVYSSVRFGFRTCMMGSAYNANWKNHVGEVMNTSDLPSAAQLSVVCNYWLDVKITNMRSGDEFVGSYYSSNNNTTFSPSSMNSWTATTDPMPVLNTDLLKYELNVRMAH